MQDAEPNAERHQAIREGMQARLKSLDLRIARMQALHADSTDPLAHKLIAHSIAERAELQAKLARA